jgi:hypothetical protein
MSKPSFYNDNEYRAYPFVDKPTVFESLSSPVPTAAIVDAGFIMHLDAEYDDDADIIYLEKVTVENNTLFFWFASTAPKCEDKKIYFRRDYEISAGVISAVDPEWTTEHTESEAIDNGDNEATRCDPDPVWVGFLVTGKIEKLVEDVIAAGGVIVFNADEYLIEPARIQNLNKAYLRSVRVGNYARTTVPVCDAENITVAPEIIFDERCLTGDIKFKEGYNAKITQTTRDNTLSFTAAKGAGAAEDDELCENYGEIPLYPDEGDDRPFIYGDADTDGKQSKFLSGGWSCKDLIFTINGIGGSNVNIIGGENVQIGYDDDSNAITVTLSKNAQGRCNG